MEKKKKDRLSTYLNVKTQQANKLSPTGRFELVFVFSTVARSQIMHITLNVQTEPQCHSLCSRLPELKRLTKMSVGHLLETMMERRDPFL